MIDTIINNHSLYLLQSIQLDKLENKIVKKQEYIDQLSKLYDNINSYGLTKQFASIIPFFSKDCTTSNLLKSFSLTNGKNYLESKELKETIFNNIKKEKEELKILEDTYINLSYNLIEYENISVEFNNEFIALENNSSSIWSKIKTFFINLYRKFIIFLKKIKKYFSKLWLKFKSLFVKDSNNFDVDTTKFLKELKQTKSQIVPLEEINTAVTISNSIIEIGSKLMNEPINTFNFNDKNETVIEALIQLNYINKTEIPNNLFKFLNSETNSIANTIDGITIFKQIFNITINETISDFKSFYNLVVKKFQEYMDKVFSLTEKSLEFIYKFINFSESEIHMSNLQSSQVFDRYYTDVINHFGICLNRLNMFFSSNDANSFKFMVTVLKSLETIGNIHDKKSIIVTNPKEVINKITSWTVGGSLENINYYFIEDINSDMAKVIGAQNEFMFKASMNMLQDNQALCCTVQGLRVPFILTSKKLKSQLSEDEFKFILYHELGHYRNGHSVDFLKLLTKLQNARSSNVFVQVVNNVFSRSLRNEIEADSYGVEKTSHDIAISALSHLNSILKSVISSYSEEEIKTRIAFINKWKQLGKKPSLPKENIIKRHLQK